MKILVIQTAFIGDLILTLPLIQTIKKNYAESIVDLLCIPYTQGAVKNNPYLNEVIVFDKQKKRKISDLLALSRDVKKRDYDISIIPHRSLRSALIASFAGIKRRIGFKKSLFEFLLTDSVIYPVGIHEVDRNLALLNDFNFLEASRVPELYPAREDEYIVLDYINSNNIEEDFICIAPGSKWFTKRWPVEYYSMLTDMLGGSGMKVILTGGAEDKEICDYISSRNKSVINSCGKFSLLQTALLIKRSLLLVSNDSAAVHLASAVNTPVIDIYGPTVPAIGFYPLSENSISMEVKDLNCRPCSIHGGKKCPAKTFDCMKNVTPEMIFAEIKRITNAKGN